MTRYVALLRAVNVGGLTLLMSDLKAICAEAGFARVETFIASGNVVFDAVAPRSRVQAELEARLLAHAGKPIGLLLRSAEEMRAVVEGNPFPAAEPKFTYALFLDAPPTDASIAAVKGRSDEQLRLGAKEIYIHYPTGMGRSKLKIPASKTGTARNMNTVAKLADLAEK
jgi:uncharacterized protein (DUF1697 family)